MLRGAIDFVAPDRVSGWIFARTGPVNGLLMQVFVDGPVDGQCIGEGVVGLYREDIEKAGLGDGLCGFSIDIHVADPSDLGRVYVRLAESDFLLKQQSAVVRGKGDHDASSETPIRWNAASIEWMRQREALSQYELDLLNALMRFGVYDRSLKQAKMAGNARPKELLSAAVEAKALLNLLSLSDFAPQSIKVDSDTELRTLRDKKSENGCYAVLYAEHAAYLNVMEGSHDSRQILQAAPTDWVGAVRYTLGPDRLVVVDLRCAMRIIPQSDPLAITAWTMSAL